MTDNTIDSEVEKQIADILGWWKARRKYIKWVGEAYDDDAEPKDEEMAAIKNLIAQEANKAVVKELKLMKTFASGYDPDPHYTKYPFYVIEKHALDERISQLTADKEQA